MSDPCNPMDWSHQTPLSMGFSRQEYWGGLPFPSPGNLLNPGIIPGTPALLVVSCIAGELFTDWAHVIPVLFLFLRFHRAHAKSWSQVSSTHIPRHTRSLNYEDYLDLKLIPGKRDAQSIVETVGSAVRLVCIILIQPNLAVWPWIIHLTSLCLSSFISNTELSVNSTHLKGLL